MYCLGNYSDYLDQLLEKKYVFRLFSEEIMQFNNILLRHDIDYDVEFALKCAKVEAHKGIITTYFFLLRSEFYNPYEQNNYEMIKEIQSLGHHIGLHFDPSIYEDVEAGLFQEVNLFENLFNQPVDIVSFHRPTSFFLNLDNEIKGINHTYQSKFTKSIKYYSDSTGKWRFGNPIKSIEFNNNLSMHLLFHPIWWFMPGNDNFDVLRNYFLHRVNNLKMSFSNNSIPFRNIESHV